MYNLNKPIVSQLGSDSDEELKANCLWMYTILLLDYWDNTSA